MYISSESLRAIHQAQVNECLARAERQRLLDTAKEQLEARTPARSRPGVLRLRSLVRALVHP